MHEDDRARIHQFGNIGNIPGIGEGIQNNEFRRRAARGHLHEITANEASTTGNKPCTHLHTLPAFVHGNPPRDVVPWPFC